MTSYAATLNMPHLHPKQSLGFESYVAFTGPTTMSVILFARAVLAFLYRV
jgi:hypothetical protein